MRRLSPSSDDPLRRRWCMVVDMSTAPKPRKDVMRNRALLLESADALIREHGLDLSLNAVAHHAGVGVGTVYRHFPDRAALIQALFEQRVERVAEILLAHIADDDPVAGIRAVVFEVCEMQASDRGVWELLSSGDQDAHRQVVQERLLPLVDQLVTRANSLGRMRLDFHANDLAVILWTGGALHAYLGSVAPEAWRRYIQLMLDGFLADDDPVRTSNDEAPLSFDEVDAAMRGWRPSTIRRD